MSNAKFAFYEIVRVQSNQKNLVSVNGLTGAILGMAQNAAGQWNYAVSIYALEECWNINESDLEATGEYDRREAFYDGEQLKLYVHLNESGQALIGSLSEIEK